MAFPGNPTNGQIYTFSNKTWQWSATENAWLSVSTFSNVTGPTGPLSGVTSVAGRTGDVVLTVSDVSGALSTTGAANTYVPIAGGTMTAALLVNSGGGGNVARVAGAASSSPVIIGVDSSSADANPVLVIQTKGTGAIVAGQPPDNTATGGNARGANAVDLQTVRATAASVASGQYAFSAGYNNTASGAQTVALGRSCVADGVSSVAIGNAALVHGIAGAFIGASGYIVNPGDAQGGQYVLRGRATSGAAARLTSDGNSAGSTNIVNIPVNTAWSGQFRVVARDTSTGNSGRWTGSFGLACQGTASTTTYTAGDIQWGNTVGSVTQYTLLSIAADTTNRGLNVTFQPPNSNTWDVVAVFSTGEVQ